MWSGEILGVFETLEDTSAPFFHDESIAIPGNGGAKRGLPSARSAAEKTTGIGALVGLAVRADAKLYSSEFKL